jgi:predicted Zn finger-like uncharacterized protein
MPIHVACPECRSTYDLVDDQRGKKVRCKKCQFIFVAEPAKNGRGDVVRDVEVVAERPSRTPAKKAAPPVAARRTVTRVDDEDDHEDERDNRRRPAPRKKKSGGASTGLLIGGLAALLVVVIVGVVGLIVLIRWMSKDDKAFNPVVADNSRPGDLNNGPIDNPVDNRPPNPFPPNPNPNPNPNPIPNPPVDPKPPREPEVEKTPPPKENPGNPPANGTLPDEARERVEHATVYIRVTMPDGGKASGTGFFGVEPNILLTNAHVLGMLKPENRPPKNIEVFVDHGEKTERKFGAQILGLDRDSDLAVLKVVLLPDQTGGKIPAPIAVQGAEGLKNLQKVYVFGFPFGESIGKEITVRESSVASLKKDKFGTLDRVQINGGIDPGNSGGPVVNANGDVVGVSVAKIRGTNIDFAIPGERVRTLLDGRIKEMGRDNVPYVQDGKIIMPVSMIMIDPLNRIKEVALEVWTGDAKQPRPPAVGEAPKPNAGDSKHERFKLAYQAGEGKADVVLPALPPGKTYYVQPYFVNGAGKSHWASGDPIETPPPVERKPVRLALEQKNGDRTLSLQLEHTFSVSEGDHSDQLFKVEMNAGLKESTTSVDPRNGAQMQLRYTSFGINVTQDGQPLDDEEKKQVESVKRYLGNLVEAMVQDPNGNLKQGDPNYGRIPPADLEQVKKTHAQVQHALESLAVNIPNKEVKYGEKWEAFRTLPLGRPGKSEMGAVKMTYTYLGVRKNAAGRDEAVIALDGVVTGTGNDQKMRDKLGGKAGGLALIDVVTGQVTNARTNVTVDMTSSAGYKLTGGLTAKLQRSVP